MNNEYSRVRALKHEIEIEIPFSIFDRNFRDFRDKHGLGKSFAYSVNTDGKFRAELKESSEDEGYILRISGWRNDKILAIRRMYCAEIIKLFDYVCDFLDLLEVWAIDHKGYLYLEYVDIDEPCMDAYYIVRGIEKTIHFTDAQLQEVLEWWES